MLLLADSLKEICVFFRIFAWTGLTQTNIFGIYIRLDCRTYRLLNLDEILEKKLVRPECGESPVAPPVPEYSSAVLFRGLVCPANAVAIRMLGPNVECIVIMLSVFISVSYFFCFVNYTH